MGGHCTPLILNQDELDIHREYKKKFEKSDSISGQPPRLYNTETNMPGATLCIQVIITIFRSALTPHRPGKNPDGKKPYTKHRHMT